MIRYGPVMLGRLSEGFHLVILLSLFGVIVAFAATVFVIVKLASRR